MNTKRLDELERENIALKAKLEMLERMYQEALRLRPSGDGGDTDALLSRLTLKQHAVMLAFFGGKTYEQIASLMQADLTTVKLHLKAACVHLGAQNRNHLAIKWEPVIKTISDEKYLKNYGVTKDWWLSQPKEVMAQLIAKRSTLYRPKPVAPSKPKPRRKTT